MSSELPVELLVIGWGKAGKTLAKRWAATGRSVAMVEKSPQMYGGTCINIACVPTKDLIVSAQRRRPQDDPQEYFTQAVAGRDSLIGKLNAANHRMLEGQAELVDGTARFIGPRKVAVDTADGELIITAETVVLGTGAVPARPDIPGIDLPRVYDSTSIQHADPLPQRLAIIGDGFIGLEFAQMFQHFGSQVTVLDSGEHFLRRAEPVVAESVHQVLTEAGVVVRQSARVQQIRQDGEALVLELADGQVQADAVLVAAGRTPATSDLSLEAAGIETDDRGFVAVDDQLRTSAEGVYAVGDVNGGPQFTYISLDDHRIVWDQLIGSGQRSRADRVAVPSTTFLTPPLSQVRMGPEEAVRRSLGPLRRQGRGLDRGHAAAQDRGRDRRRHHLHRRRADPAGAGRLAVLHRFPGADQSGGPGHPGPGHRGRAEERHLDPPLQHGGAERSAR